MGGELQAVYLATRNDWPLFHGIIRKALAIGADAAYRVDAVPQDSWYAASQIAAFARGRNYDLILLGKETIDHNGSETGCLLAGILDLPYVAYASKLGVNGQTATLESEIEGGVKVSEVALPLVVSCAKGMAEQRIPNMRGIMAARTKPLQVIAVNPSDTKGHTLKFDLNPGRSECKYFTEEQLDELVNQLHTNAKVI